MSSHSTPKTRGKSRNDLNRSETELTKCNECNALFSNKDISKHNSSVCQFISNINYNNNRFNNCQNYSQLLKHNFAFISDQIIYANVIQIDSKGILFSLFYR